MIEVTISHDKTLNSLTHFQQLLYLKVLPHTDDYGRFEGDPEVLKARVDPLSKTKLKLYVEAIEAISNAGLWFWYETDNGKKILQYNPDSFERINAFLIKKRGNPEYPEFNKDLYKAISNDIAYKEKSNKQQAESRKQKENGSTAIETSETHPLIALIRDRFPQVSRLEIQPSYESADKLVVTYGMPLIEEVLESMENFKGLTNKYRNAVLTINNWCKRRKESNGQGQNRQSPTVNSQLARAQYKHGEKDIERYRKFGENLRAIREDFENKGGTTKE